MSSPVISQPSNQLNTPTAAVHALRSSRRVFWAGVLALVLPAVLLGPWLPLVDLVGFVGMYSYPPSLSQGPFHYYTFQFSYIGFHALSRLMCDLHLPVRFQIPIYYLLQVGICFGIVYGSLSRLVRNAWVRNIGIALGTLALWDGIFLWGGPLAHSLGAASISLATYLAIRDAAEPEKNGSVFITLLVLFGISCHPFILPFALVLCGVRFLFDARRRWQTVALTVAVLVFGYVIVRDSPAAESGAADRLQLLFGLRPGEIVNRITGLFVTDARFARMLFGEVPFSSHIVFLVFGTLHAAGFVLSPWIAITARSSTWLRMLCTLNTVAGGLYLLSCDLPGAPISDWPQRVLTLYAPFTYVAGFVGLLYAFGKLRPTSGVAAERPQPRLGWLVPATVLGFAVLVQAQIFRLGDTVEANLNKVRQEILQSGLTNAYVVTSGMDNIKPFYLRGVPFMLFSDPELIARNIIISTEWHIKARHPSRVTEAAFNLGRKRYLAEFSSQDSVLSVRLIQQPSNRFPVSERTNQNTWSTAHMLAADQHTMGIDLFKSGVPADAWEHFNTAIHLAPEYASAWNNAGAALFHMGRHAEARAHFEKAIAVDPKFTDPRNNLAALLIDAGQLPQAAAQLNEVLRLEPANEKARMLLDTLKAAAAKKPEKK